MKIKSRKQSTLKKAIIISVIVLVAAIAYVVYAKMNTAWPFTKDTQNTTLGGSDTNKPPKNTNDNNPSKDPDDKITPAIDATTAPDKPVGTFVSNHHPNLSGNPAPNQMSSTCTTTPGAECQIRFTKGDIVKNLPVKTTSSNGTANWNWKLQDINLSAGDWRVTAIASNGDKTVEASDPMQLSVQE